MVIKSLSRKRDNFGDLLRYINRLPASQLGKTAVLFNLPTTDDLARIERAFVENFRKPSHRVTHPNGVTMYHEILSIAADDREQVTEEMLNDLARQYLSTRAPDCLAYARAQFDTKNPHIHIMISAHRLDGSKVRLSKFQFGNAKRQLERYQQEQYPELEHSVVQSHRHGRTRTARIATTIKEGEQIRRERTQGKTTPTRKAQIREQVRDIFIRSRTDAELIESFSSTGFVPYVRGQTPGVVEMASGRKYRLKTLGLEAEARERMVALKVVGDRERAIKEILHDQARTEERERAQGRDDDLDDDLEYPAPMW